MRLTLKRDPEDKGMFHMRYVQEGTQTNVMLFGSVFFDCLWDVLHEQIDDEQWELLESGEGSVELELKVVK